MFSSFEDDRLRVVFLEGTHGVGKTSIINELKARGYTVVPEGFDLNDSNIEIEDYVAPEEQGHNFACELEWVGRMYKKLYRLAAGFNNGKILIKDNLIFVDRSFITAMIYGKLTDKLGIQAYIHIVEMMKDQLKIQGLDCMIIYLSRRNEMRIQYEKILERLAQEPMREGCNERSFEWLQECYRRYEKAARDFNCHTITLSDAYHTDVKKVTNKILKRIDWFFQVMSWNE